MYLKPIIAHRGFSDIYPENTMLAFKEAIALGVQCIETDVTILKDGTLVLFHDYETKKHTNYQGIIHDLDKKMLKTVDAGSWKSEQFVDLRLPTLEDLLILAKEHNCILNLELKGIVGQDEEYWDSIVTKTIEMVKKMGVEDLVFYSSFEFPMLRKIKQISSYSPFGILLGKEIGHWKEIADELSPKAIHLNDKTVTPELLKAIKKEHYKIYIYMVNDKKSAEHFFALGVDGIFTDKPNLFKVYL